MCVYRWWSIPRRWLPDTTSHSPKNVEGRIIRTIVRDRRLLSRSMWRNETHKVGGGNPHTHVKLIWFQREIKFDDDYFSLSLTAEKGKKQFSIWIIFGEVWVVESLWKFRAAVREPRQPCVWCFVTSAVAFISIYLFHDDVDIFLLLFPFFFSFFPNSPRLFAFYIVMTSLDGYFPLYFFFLLAPKKK